MKFNEDIYREFEISFRELGFLDSRHFIHNGCLDFYRKTSVNMHWVRLVFGLDSKGFVQINSFISFSTVTNILREFIPIKTDFIEEIVKNNYIRSQWPDLMQEFCALPLNTSTEREVFKERIMQHVYDYILPFFDKIPNLQSVNDQILNKIPEEEYADYIPGQTNFKVLIIMKLCNNPKYESFKNWALEAYKRGAEMDESRYGADFETLQSLVTYLDDEHLKDY